MTDYLDIALKREGDEFKKNYLWLKENMPRIFFEETDEDPLFLIAHTLGGFSISEYFSELHLKNSSFVLTLDTPESDLKILERYPHRSIKNYVTYISREVFPGTTALLKIARLDFTSKDVTWRASHLLEEAEKNDYCVYETIWNENETPATLQVNLAWKDVSKHNFLYRLARVVYRHDLVMRRVHAIYTESNILMLSFTLETTGVKQAGQKSDLEDFFQEMTTLKYFGSLDGIDRTFVQTKQLSGNMANWLRACMNFIHQILSHADPYLYSFENIEEGLLRHPDLTLLLCRTFEYKFHPDLCDEKQYNHLCEEFSRLVHQIDTGYVHADKRRKNILLQGMNFVKHTLKTNFYCQRKTAFAFRLAPVFLNFVPFKREEIFPEIPVGVFYFKGMHYVGFHIRFKDIARGGLRTIYPEKQERMLAERHVVFSECYNLAYTQQKKNKDIPEGGAKGVIFLKPDIFLNEEAAIYLKEISLDHNDDSALAQKVEVFKKSKQKEALYQAQRSYVTSLLALLNSKRDARIIDYYKKPEYIYLGPDENMHDPMIEWIADESQREGYSAGRAFITGKKIGINHKEYGVTSRGVQVYVEEILKFLGIDPFKEGFSVKMTGGPDGDVAGNEICNLQKFFPHTAHLIALTDVSGTIYDPVGLDLSLCAQLFHESKSIRHYPQEALHEGGYLLDREMKKEITPYLFQTLCYRKEGGTVVTHWLGGDEAHALYRHNVHQTYADIFIPCGGRPASVNEMNAEEVVGKAKAIVEGANLYLTEKARKILESHGTLIVKDSSANKTGVITSSYEVLSGLVLTEDEFLENKEQLIEEIVQKITDCARNEAHILLQSHAETDEPLTEISEKISQKINGLKLKLEEYLAAQDISTNPLLMQCYFNYVLPTLRGKFKERLLTNVPISHQKAIVATYIATHIVYKHGLSWAPAVVDVLPQILNDVIDAT